MERGCCGCCGARHRQPGWVFTAAGAQQRLEIGSLTDALGELPYRVLTDDEAETLRATGRVLSAKVVEAGLLPGR